MWSDDCFCTCSSFLLLALRARRAPQMGGALCALAKGRSRRRRDCHVPCTGRALHGPGSWSPRTLGHGLRVSRRPTARPRGSTKGSIGSRQTGPSRPESNVMHAIRTGPDFCHLAVEVPDHRACAAALDKKTESQSWPKQRRESGTPTPPQRISFVRTRPAAARFVAEPLLEDRDVVLTAVRADPREALRCAPERWRRDRGFVAHGRIWVCCDVEDAGHPHEMPVRARIPSNTPQCIRIVLFLQRYFNRIVLASCPHISGAILVLQYIHTRTTPV